MSKASSLHAVRHQPYGLKNLCLSELLSQNFLHPELFSEFNAEIQNQLLSYYTLVRKPILPDNYLKENNKFDAIRNKAILRNFCTVAANMLNESTLKLDFSLWGMEKWPCDSVCIHFPQVIIAASTKSPNLEFLAFKSVQNVDEDSEGEDDEITRIPKDCFQSLVALKKLRHLHVAGTWKWTTQNVRLLGARLTLLETVQISLSKKFDPKLGLSTLPRLEKLSEFLFLSDGEEMEEDLFSAVYNGCAEKGRHLKVIGCKVEKCFYFDFMDCLPAFKNFVANIKGTSPLEHLHSAHSLPDAEFPELQHLFLHGPLNDSKILQKLGTYKNLFHLALVCMEFDFVVSALKLIGGQLLFLYVDGEDWDLDVYHVLSLCPNLIELASDSYTSPTSTYQEQVTSQHFRLMERVYLRFRDRAPKDLIKFILTAPHIEIACLKRLMIAKKDCEAVESLSKESLVNLEKFVLQGLYLHSTCSVGKLGSFIKTIIASAPKLEDIQVSWLYFDFNPDYQKWFAEQGEVVALMQLIKAKK